MLQMDTVLRLDEIRLDIFGVPIVASVTLARSYATSIDFSLNGSPYTFHVERWASRGFARFITLFFAHEERDPSTYGAIIECADGAVNIQMNVTQKCNAIVQATKDVMSCLNKVSTRYRRSVLDYAVWYREKHPEEDTYSQFITLRTCHCIVHSDFLAPNLTWELVTF